LKGWKSSNIWEQPQNSVQEEIKSRLSSGNACSFGAESVVFQVAIQKLKIKTYRTIILPVVLYGCETWSIILREERRPRVFENRVLRRRRMRVRGVKKLHNEELHDLYS
jgi:hypothetical protein